MLTISGGEGAVNNNENFILPPNFYCFHIPTEINLIPCLHFCVYTSSLFSQSPLVQIATPLEGGGLGIDQYTRTLYTYVVIFMVFLLRLCSYFYRLVLPSTFHNSTYVYCKTEPVYTVHSTYNKEPQCLAFT